MALQGTLDTFALPDVLRLLATTNKTGQLLVQGDQGNGALYLDGGAVVGAETTLATTTAADEVLFELLRLVDGSFLFDQDVPADEPGAPADVEAIIADAEASHAEWLELSEVVPSLDADLRLVDELVEETTTLDRDRWRLVVTIGGGATVGSVGERLGLGELPVLREVRGLIDDGLATIVEYDDRADLASGDGFDLDTSDRTGPEFPAGAVGGADDLDLPSLDDDDDRGALFEDSAGDDELPEPLLVGTVGVDGAALSPEEAASLEGQIEELSAGHRALVERAADIADPVAAEELLDELPDGAIDRDLMRRFLGSVRS